MNESRLLNTVLLEEIGFHLIEKFVMHLQVLAYNFQYMFVVHIIGVKKKNSRADPHHRLNDFVVVTKVTAGAFRR
jgi:hypothetical protein